MASSHATRAKCNDCHTPTNPLGKYFTKALNGYTHSLAFTTGNFDDPIKIGERNLQIAQQSCLKCHADIFNTHEKSQRQDCLTCHKETGH